MKKLRALVIGIVLIIVVLIAGSKILSQSSGMSGAKIINIYNWGCLLYTSDAADE